MSQRSLCSHLTLFKYLAMSSLGRQRGTLLWGMSSGRGVGCLFLLLLLILLKSVLSTFIGYVYCYIYGVALAIEKTKLIQIAKFMGNLFEGKNTP